MGKARVELQTDIAYELLPLPRKIILPLKPGKVGFVKYSQHPEDPVAVELIDVAYLGSNRLKILLRVTGRLDLKPGPDLRLGGTQAEVEGNLVLQDLEIRLQDITLKRLDVAKLPAGLDEWIHRMLGKTIVEELEKNLRLDLHQPFTQLRNEVNRPQPWDFNIGEQTLHYQYTAGMGDINPTLRLSPKAILLTLEVELAPEIVEVTR